MRHREYDINTLREQVTRDTATLQLEKDRLRRFHHTKSDDLNPAEQAVIINWSRASIRGYNEKLEVMEELGDPAPEDRQIMQLLNELIVIGDQLSEIHGRYWRMLEEKFGKLPEFLHGAELPEGAHVRPNDGKVTMPREKRTPGSVEGTSIESAFATARSSTALPAARPSSLLPTNPTSNMPPQPQPKTAVPPSASARPEYDRGNKPPQAPSSVPQPSSSEEAIIRADPKGIYAMLRLTPEASMDQLNRAIKRQKALLHPDRNRDPDASIRFGEFVALVEATVKTEEMRRAYDSIRTAGQLEKLTKRVSELMMSAAPR